MPVQQGVEGSDSFVSLLGNYAQQLYLRNGIYLPPWHRSGLITNSNRVITWSTDPATQPVHEVYLVDSWVVPTEKPLALGGGWGVRDLQWMA